MAELKTQKNDGDVTAFLSTIENEKRREDAFTLLQFMKDVTGEPPVMWGDSIIGFGSYHYRYSSGKEGDWPLTGFSPRKQNLTIYLMSGFKPFENEMRALGKYKTGSSCLYVNRLSDINIDLLKDMIPKSMQIVRDMYNSSK